MSVSSRTPVSSSVERTRADGLVDRAEALQLPSPEGVELRRSRQRGVGPKPRRLVANVRLVVARRPPRLETRERVRVARRRRRRQVRSVGRVHEKERRVGTYADELLDVGGKHVGRVLVRRAAVLDDRAVDVERVVEEVGHVGRREGDPGVPAGRDGGPRVRVEVLAEEAGAVARPGAARWRASTLSVEVR